MCGIVGYVGPNADDKALGVVMEGLARLEYRGYDSAGVALVADGEVHEGPCVCVCEEEGEEGEVAEEAGAPEGVCDEDGPLCGCEAGVGGEERGEEGRGGVDRVQVGLWGEIDGGERRGCHPLTARAGPLSSLHPRWRRGLDHP